VVVMDDDVVVDGVVTRREEINLNHKSCDLLRVGSIDLHYYYFRSCSSPPSTNHVSCG
jgi:hypothetical protein